MSSRVNSTRRQPIGYGKAHKKTTMTTTIRTVKGMKMMTRTEEASMMKKVTVTQEMKREKIIRKMVRRRMPETMAITVMMKMLINNVEVMNQVTTIIGKAPEVLRAA